MDISGTRYEVIPCLDIGDYKKHIATIQTKAKVLDPILIEVSGMGHVEPSKHVKKVLEVVKED